MAALGGVSLSFAQNYIFYQFLPKRMSEAKFSLPATVSNKQRYETRSGHCNSIYGLNMGKCA